MFASFRIFRLCDTEDTESPTTADSWPTLILPTASAMTIMARLGSESAFSTATSPRSPWESCLVRSEITSSETYDLSSSGVLSYGVLAMTANLDGSFIIPSLVRTA